MTYAELKQFIIDNPDIPDDTEVFALSPDMSTYEELSGPQACLDPTDMTSGFPTGIYFSQG